MSNRLDLELPCEGLPFVEVGDRVAHLMVSYRVTKIEGRIIHLRRLPLKQQHFHISALATQKEPTAP